MRPPARDRTKSWPGAHHRPQVVRDRDDLRRPTTIRPRRGQREASRRHRRRPLPVLEATNAQCREWPRSPAPPSRFHCGPHELGRSGRLVASDPRCPSPHDRDRDDARAAQPPGPGTLPGIDGSYFDPNTSGRTRSSGSRSRAGVSDSDYPARVVSEPAGFILDAAGVTPHAPDGPPSPAGHTAADEAYPRMRSARSS